MFMACLNVSVGLIIGLQLPGSEWTQASETGVNATDYEEHFNSTRIVGSWWENIIYSIPLFGDIFSGLQFLWGNVQYLVDGFPMFLTWVSDTYITDAEGRIAFGLIANALRGLYAIMFSVMVIEFLSGRYMTD